MWVVQFVRLNVLELCGMHVFDCCVTIAVQAAMPYGSMVELLHPQRASEIVGHGRAHIHGRSNSSHAVLVPFGAQVVTITDVMSPNCELPYPAPHKNGKMMQTLSDAVGWKVYWPIRALCIHAAAASTK